jgi:hypothetical protein
VGDATNTGATGPAGDTGYTGDTGPTGPSIWTTTGNDIYYNAGEVAIGKTSPSYELDVSGSIQVSQFIRVNKMTEQIFNFVSGSNSNEATSSTITIDYTNGAIYYIGTTYTNSLSNPFSLSILNLNTATDTFRSFSLTLLMDIGDIRPYADTLYLSSNSTAGTTANTPVYPDGSVSVNSEATTIIQSFTIIYSSGLWRIFSSVTNYY